MIVEDDTGRALVRFRLRDDEGQRVASLCAPLGTTSSRSCGKFRRCFAGFRLETSQEGL